jgi:proteasome lid subunit RPN8/RPN11
MKKPAKAAPRMSEPDKEASVIAIEPIVKIDSEVTRRIRQHARSHSKTEVCGVLIGEDVNGTIDIRASIEALNATQAGTHVTFTQDAWEEIYRVKDDLYPNDRIVGWYHSHPGFGVFLSEHDMFIQQNFFSSPGQVAWVFDPHSDEEGCFGWVSGEVHRLSSLSVIDNNGDGIERTTKRSAASQTEFEMEEDGDLDVAPARRRGSSSGWMHWVGTIFSHVSALALGFALAYFLFPRVLAVLIDPVTGEFVVRDGQSLIPYLDQQRIPLPPGAMAPNQPPSGASSPTTPPTHPQSPGPGSNK